MPSALLAFICLKPLSQNARPLRPFGSSWSSSCLPSGPLRHLVHLLEVVEQVRQVERLVVLQAHGAELAEGRRQHLEALAELQGLELFLVLVEAAVRVELDLDAALGAIFDQLLRVLRRLAFGRVGGVVSEAET